MATQAIQDILDAEIPSPSFVIAPTHAAPIPSGMTLSRPDRDDPDPTAQTLDSRRGLYVGSGADQPRIYGSDQDLLIEPQDRTNRVPHGFSPLNWDAQPSFISGAETNIVEQGGDALDLRDDVRMLTSAGSFSDNRETVTFLVERHPSLATKEMRVIVRDISNSYQLVSNFVNLKTETIESEHKQTVESHLIPVTDYGPALGGKVYRYVVHYDASGKTDPREVWFRPDGSASGGHVALHGAQVEHARNGTTPIPTGGSQTKRAGDDYTIFSGGRPEWWNDREMTYVCELTRRYHGSSKLVGGGGHYILSDGASYRLAVIVGNNLRVNDGSGAQVIGEVNPYDTIKFAVSLSPFSMRWSSKSPTKTTSGEVGHNENLLTAINALFLGELDRAMFSLKSLKFIPAFLEISTLETLTA